MLSSCSSMCSLCFRGGATGDVLRAYFRRKDGHSHSCRCPVESECKHNHSAILQPLKCSNFCRNAISCCWMLVSRSETAGLGANLQALPQKLHFLAPQLFGYSSQGHLRSSQLKVLLLFFQGEAKLGSARKLWESLVLLC